MPGGAPSGRGVAQNTRNRFEKLDYQTDDYVQEVDSETGAVRTEFYRDSSRSIVSENDSPDVGMAKSVNPYRGCEHGCAYCYARPYHEYLGMSAGLDFETKIMVKEDAPDLLRKTLSSPKWKPESITLSGVTDPYQPIERKLEITRRCLQVLLDFRNPVGIITKNRLVTRDIDILGELARFNAAAVFVSVTTLNLKLNRVLEPRTSSPAQRLDAIRQLSQAGVPVGTMVAPIIPGLTDHEIPNIVAAVAEAGAKFAGRVVLRLPYAVAPLFEEWLERHFPERKDKVLNRIRAMRGGKLYSSEFGKRMSGEGKFAEQIHAMFKIACARAGLKPPPPLSTAHFRRPAQHGDQLGLFDAES